MKGILHNNFEYIKLHLQSAWNRWKDFFTGSKGMFTFIIWNLVPTTIRNSGKILIMLNMSKVFFIINKSILWITNLHNINDWILETLKSIINWKTYLQFQGKCYKSMVSGLLAWWIKFDIPDIAITNMSNEHLTNFFEMHTQTIAQISFNHNESWHAKCLIGYLFTKEDAHAFYYTKFRL